MTVIFILIIVTLIVEIPKDYCTVQANKAVNEGDTEKYNKFFHHVLYLHGIESATSSIAHWTFAIEYLKMSLKLPIITNFYEDDINEQLRKADRTVFIWQCIFYV